MWDSRFSQLWTQTQLSREIEEAQSSIDACKYKKPEERKLAKTMGETIVQQPDEVGSTVK